MFIQEIFNTKLKVYFQFSISGVPSDAYEIKFVMVSFHLLKFLRWNIHFAVLIAT